MALTAWECLLGLPLEAALEKVTPVADRADFCHRAVLFGREYCRAQSPACDACPLFLSEEV